MARLRALGMVTVVFATAVVAPRAWVERLPLCLIRWTTGWECPGCGLTRAFLAMVHGRWREVFTLNALAPAVAVFLMVYAADGLYTQWKGQRPPWYSPGGRQWIVALFGVLTFGQWLYKSGLHFYKIYLN